MSNNNNNLNLSDLKSHTNDILKAEIGALLFNLGKTHIGFWKEKNGVVYFNVDDNKFKSVFGYKPFSGYKSYYEKHPDINKTPFEFELEKTSNKLRDFIFNEKVKFSFNIEPQNKNKKECLWSSFFKGNALTESEDCYNFIQKVFFRGCENINSGIDKGSPQDLNQLSQLWISNAFGSITKKVTDEKDFDAYRVCFLRDLHKFLVDNYYYNSPDWDKIRNFMLGRIKPWYSRLLSDSRFPVNDVTLWDQVYMTASMFKAALSAMFLDNTKALIYVNDPQKIKWSILGIQYDKLGLAEKGLKAASIKWYRDTSKIVDNKIKKIIEVDYAIGNEVYRDETGIYFIVGENIIGKKEGDFYKLNENLSELKDEIVSVFSEDFEGEMYPAILLTEPSRGLMNLGHLIEKSEENFLKAEVPPNLRDFLEDDDKPEGICQVCGVRLASEKDEKGNNKDNLICNVCLERQRGRIDEWTKKLDGETIWTGELQDKNGRIALVTLKFELDRWINGDLVNSLLMRNEGENYIKSVAKIKNFIKLFLANIPIDFGENALIAKIDSLKKKLNSANNQKEKSNIGREKGELEGIRRKISYIKNKISYIKSIQWYNKGLSEDLKIPGLKGNNFEDFFSHIKDQYKSIKKNFNINLLEVLTLFPLELSEDAYRGCKKNGESFNDYIRQLFFGSIRGNEWENIVKKSPLHSKIQWNNEVIIWDKLTDSDIEFLSSLILQFLLRKNPSPARLKRIWDTTKEFFKELESKITDLAEIPEERRQRIVWSNKSHISDGEYWYGDIEFWARKGTIYLITSIEKTNGKNAFTSKSKGNSSATSVNISKSEGQKQGYKPCFTILSPTPVSWQFIIPAEYVPNLIKNVQKEYYKSFKWVYGKLPLHMGVVVQNYKKPLYVGIKALRKIRRDGMDWKSLGHKIIAKDFRARQKVAFYYQQIPEQNADCENFYSFYERADSTQKQYEFYLYPEGKKVWIDTTQNSSDADRFWFYPDTFDFEFLDTNTRRNDIYYGDNAKRVIRYKMLRPYDIEDWQYFNKFYEYFNKDKNSSSKMQKLVSLIYSKLEDWGDSNLDVLKQFMTSAFINVLDLKDDKSKKEFAAVLGYEDYDKLENSNADEFKNKLLMFIDMFEFWHTMLKKI